MALIRRVVVALLLGVALGASASQRQGSNSPEREFQSALSHYNAGNFHAAAQELEALVGREPESFDVHELLAMVYSAEGQDQAASAHFEKAVRLKPNSAPARANLAVNLARLGKNQRAEAEFKKAIEIEPDNFDANHDFGEFYIRAGNLAAAIPFLERAQQREPSAGENGYDLALAYEQTGQLAQARREIESLLARKNSAELHNLLAEVEERSGNYLAAANQYQQAAQMDASEPNIFDWGSELLVHHTLDPAVEVFSEGLKRYPESTRLAVGLGLAFYLRSNYDEAVAALLRAIDLAPSDARAYDFLSKAYDMSPNQTDEVIEHFRRFAELQPHNARAVFYYGMSLWKGKRSESSGARLEQVESLLKQSASLDPSFTDARLQLGNLYSQQKKYAEAVPEYQAALKLDPNVPDAHYRLGQAYSHIGQKDLAQKEFQLHQALYEKHLADVDEQRGKVRQFIYSMKGDHAGS